LFRLELAGIGAEPHGAAVFLHVLLFEHHIDHVLIGLLELGAVGVLESAHRPREFNDRALQAEADAQERDIVFPDVAHGQDLPLDAPLAEAGCHEQSVQPRRCAAAPSRSISSALIQRMSTPTLFAAPAWTNASAMLLYASWWSVYLPQIPIRTRPPVV